MRSVRCLFVLAVLATASESAAGPILYAGWPPPGAYPPTTSATNPPSKGGTRTYSNFDTSAFSELYFGYSLVEGPLANNVPQSLVFSTLNATEAIWNAPSLWTYNDGFGTKQAPVRFRNSFQDLSGNSIMGSVALASSLGIVGTPYVLQIDAASLTAWGGGFKSFQSIEALVNGIWTPVDYVNTTCSGCTKSGTTGAFWYEEPIAAAEPASLSLLATSVLLLPWAIRRRGARLNRAI